MHGVLYSHKEEWSIDTGYNMGEPWNHYAKWRQSQKATYDMIPFIWNIQDGQILFLFLASRHGLQDLSSPTRDWSPGPSSESVASFSLHHHGILQEWSDSFFFFKLYNIVLVLPNMEMNLPQVYMCSPSWALLPPPSPYPPSGSSQCTSPKHPVSCIEPGLATRFIHDIIHVSILIQYCKV